MVANATGDTFSSPGPIRRTPVPARARPGHGADDGLHLYVTVRVGLIAAVTDDAARLLACSASRRPRCAGSLRKTAPVGRRRGQRPCGVTRTIGVRRGRTAWELRSATPVGWGARHHACQAALAHARLGRGRASRATHPAPSDHISTRHPWATRSVLTPGRPGTGGRSSGPTPADPADARDAPASSPAP